MQWPEPLEVRREILSALIKEIKTASIELSESLAANTKELVRVAKGFGFEGIVAKRKDSVYESGKRPARGSSTGSTVGRSLSSADTRQGIRLTC
jgi:ATP-dependent DNA ligase